LARLKAVAKPSSQEADDILEVMLNPSYLSDDEKNDPIISAVSVYNIAFLSATYSGIKKGSAIRAYDNRFHEVPNAYGRISVTVMESLLRKLRLEYAKVKEVDTLFSYYIARDKTHLDLVDSMLSAKSPRFDEVSGKFFDHPECCVEAYVKLGNSGMKMKNLAQSQITKLSRGFTFASCFVVPCTLNCEELTRLGTNWLDILTDMYGQEFSRLLESYIKSRHHTQIRIT
jgi:hypothetical protein